MSQSSSYLVLDETVLIGLVGNDSTLISQFQKDFIAQVKQVMGQLQAALNNTDFDELQSLAHFLKSSAKVVGAEQVVDTLVNIEKWSEEKNCEQCQVLLKRLANNLEDVEEQVENGRA